MMIKTAKVQLLFEVAHLTDSLFKIVKVGQGGGDGR